MAGGTKGLGKLILPSILIRRYRFPECASEHASEHAIEGATHNKERTDDQDDAEDFVKDTRAAFGSKMLIRPFNAAKVIYEPLRFQHKERADDDNDEANSVFHGCSVLKIVGIDNSRWRVFAFLPAIAVDDVGFESRSSLRSTGQAYDLLGVCPASDTKIIEVDWCGVNKATSVDSSTF